MSALLATFLVIGSLGTTALAADNKLTITGSSTMAPLVSEMAKAFEKKNKGTRLDVQTGGSSRGIADPRAGLADVGMVSRALKADEKDLTAYTVAMDGVAVIVHKTNTVSQLTNEQIIGIYTGQIKNWKAVGGKDASITVVNKAEGRSTLELFLSYFMLKNTDIKAQVVIGDNEQGVKTVAGNPNAIGYVSVGTAVYDSNIGVPIKILPLASIQASIENVKNRTFPLSRPLNLVIRGQPSTLQKKFIDYALSNEVTELIKKEYFVPSTQR